MHLSFFGNMALAFYLALVADIRAFSKHFRMKHEVNKGMLLLLFHGFWNNNVIKLRLLASVGTT